MNNYVIIKGFGSKLIDPLQPFLCIPLKAYIHFWGSLQSNCFGTNIFHAEKMIERIVHNLWYATFHFGMSTSVSVSKSKLIAQLEKTLDILSTTCLFLVQISLTCSCFFYALVFALAFALVFALAFALAFALDFVLLHECNQIKVQASNEGCQKGHQTLKQKCINHSFFHS